MLSKVISCLLLTSFLHAAINAKEFQFLNKLPGEIWVGCQGNDNITALNNGGWKLAPGQKMSVYSADDWAGRFWGRTGCNPITQHCLTGDCGSKLQCNGVGGEPPATVAEFTLKGLDYYDISLVDGFNTKISIEPLRGQRDSSKNSCIKIQCTHNILSDCPDKLRVKNNGQTVGCSSACNKFQTDEYCCRGAHNTSETCRSSDWDVDYPKKFKEWCHDAYSYAFDDQKSTFTCEAPIYLITFEA